MLKGKNILIGLTGGIAAYKIPQLIRDLKKSGASVKIVMTDAAKEFVTPLTLSTVSGNEVVMGNFPQSDSNVLSAGTWHIDLAQWAHVMLIAPATANTIAKLAHGYADNAVTTLALAMRAPVVVSPSMDVDMWQRTQTQNNITSLRELGYIILPPEEGELASGLVGQGRLPDLPKIQNAVEEILQFAHQDFRGKKILITAGPTREAIDPVRYIGNRSSGKMGFALATAAAHRGAEVKLITGHVQIQTPKNVHRIDVENAQQMYNAVMKHKKGTDAIIMAAAVADFTPINSFSKKVKKEELDNDTLLLKLKKTKDILHSLGEGKKEGVLVGFSLETHNDIHNAMEKLKRKKLDLIILNNPKKKGAAFDSDTNIVTIISKNGKIEKLKKMPKYDVANEILNRVSKLLK
ncbi:MAG: bifunctional phosphopantothenoylcysteine decarboxylase/phosphopantothenate--cysteine ligase CoaBC [Bacteroidota bacterium]|nr:bifunctional phosphopantothenoylcysteine decarboxylase/phosphopantothenate--cysteine ligase CoaBC [Bacteroidota bacterium]